jgi:putative FmdB family regulatory protein
MPTYEYVCTDCGTNVEVFQRMADEPLTTCGLCGGRLRKVFHPAGILLKGSGFYKTDSRAKSTSAASGDGSKEGAKKDTGKGKKDTDKSSAPASTSTGSSKEKSA